MGYSFRLTARVLLYASSTDRIAHTKAFVTPDVDNWLEQKIAQWAHHELTLVTAELHLTPSLKKQNTRKKKYFSFSQMLYPIFQTVFTQILNT